MNPFLVTPQNKKMALENISFLLRNFLENPALETVIFGWVLPEEEILAGLRQRLTGIAFREYDFTLQCTQKALRERLEKDIRSGRREPDIMERSMARLPLYESMRTRKIDVTDISPREAAERIAAAVLQEEGEHGG